MITPLTNGAGGNDHLDLLRLRAAKSLAGGGRLPERLETSPAVSVDQVGARRTFQLPAARSTVIQWRCHGLTRSS